MQFANHKGVQITAGNRTAQAECTGLVGCKRQFLSLAWIGTDLQIVTINIEAMNYYLVKRRLMEAVFSGIILQTHSTEENNA